MRAALSFMVLRTSRSPKSDFEPSLFHLLSAENVEESANWSWQLNRQALSKIPDSMTTGGDITINWLANAVVYSRSVGRGKFGEDVTAVWTSQCGQECQRPFFLLLPRWEEGLHERLYAAALFEGNLRDALKTARMPQDIGIVSWKAKCRIGSEGDTDLCGKRTMSSNSSNETCASQVVKMFFAELSD